MEDMFRYERLKGIKDYETLNDKDIKKYIMNIVWQINDIQNVVVELYDKVENIEKQLNKSKKEVKKKKYECKRN